MKRFEIWFADLPRIDGSHVQQGFRPILIISNDRANTYSPVIIAIPLTSRLTKRPMPTHVRLQGHGWEFSKRHPTGRQSATLWQFSSTWRQLEGR